ncbi:MAG: aspartate/glutamate racemase family protein [Coriobacteriaceae bacterium]|jgi:hypothetical protein|nr:aspartate/glutamate racemase family protein [Coriobacteriaceae bacterium]
MPARRIGNERERRGVIEDAPRTTAGFPIGVVAIRLDYPKLPGNVVNAQTFRFPVLYEEVDFEIERLFAGDPALVDAVVDAARRLEASGVRAIVGACGFFAHFQERVADAVSVPVFMSSLVQVPIIEAGLKRDQKILVFAADGPSVNAELLAHVGARPDRLIVQNVGDREAFAPIRWEKHALDNGALIDDLVALARKQVGEHPEIGAILLECSDLPPYAADLQEATGLPVFDFITLINWAHQAVAQPRYYGEL